MHRSGAGYRSLRLRRPRLLLIVLLALQLLQVALWVGRSPEVHRAGDLIVLNSGVRQAADLRSFIMSPERNADTWFNFSMLWPLSGGYMQRFGVGVHQARFFYLLLSALALPFIVLCARRLYGNTAAFCRCGAGHRHPPAVQLDPRPQLGRHRDRHRALRHVACARRSPAGRLRLPLRLRGGLRRGRTLLRCRLRVDVLLVWLLWWLRAWRRGAEWRDAAFGGFVRRLRALHAAVGRLSHRAARHCACGSAGTTARDLGLGVHHQQRRCAGRPHPE